VMRGVEDSVRVIRLADRRAAIAAAVNEAVDGDAVLILGKGHERGQEIAGFKHPFDDRIEGRTALASRRGEQP
jgi:UDP-N-acetylmuramoyl-L-alanyl-D-glutamate--2,6-diaminopimelate ligase